MGSKFDWSKTTAAAQKAKWPEVLRFLVDVWAKSFDGEVADVIEQVSRQLGASVYRDDRASAQWSKFAQEKKPELLEALLTTVTAETAAIAIERLEALQGWPEDPRLERWVVAQFEQVTYRASSARPFWTRLKKLVPALHDAQAIERLRAVIARYVVTDYVERDLKELAQKWLDQALAKASTQKPDPSIVDRQALTALRAALPAPRVNAAAKIEAQVLASPKSLGAREVAADALMEVGAVRGELIALQKAPESRDGLRRISTLIAKNLAELIGPVKDVVLKEGLVFENGYLTRATLSSANPRALEQVVNSPFWSTVQALEVRRTRVDWKPVLQSKTFTSLTSLRTDDSNLGEALSDGSLALPTVSALDLFLPDRGLGAFAGVPKLTNLTVNCGPDELAGVRSWAGKRELEHLGVVLGVDYDVSITRLKALETWWQKVPSSRSASVTIERLESKAFGSTYRYDLATKRLAVSVSGNSTWLPKVLDDVCTLLTRWKLPGTIQVPRGVKLAAQPRLAKALEAAKVELEAP